MKIAILALAICSVAYADQAIVVRIPSRPPPRHAIDGLRFDAILDSIADVETGANDHAIGRRGERSRFQMMSDVWYQHSQLPFATHASDVGYARFVAATHLRWLIDGFESRGIEATTQRLALAWRIGRAAALSGRIRPEHMNYAQRVSNMCRDRLRRAPDSGRSIK